MDHTILNSGIVLSYTKSPTRILQLQEKHGVGNVIFSSPTSISSDLPSDESEQRICIYNLTDDVFYELEIQTALVEYGYNCTVNIYNSLSNLDEEIDIKVIILIGGNMTTLFKIAHLPFILYKWESNYFLREHGLEHRIAKDEKELLQILSDNNDDIYSHNMYCKTLSSYIPLYQRLEFGLEKNDIFYIDKSLYSNPSTLSQLTEIFWTDGASAKNGVYLDIAVIRTYHFYRRPHLYPWIGIIETSDLDDVREFLLSKEFQISMCMCLGLITFNQDIDTLIDGRVPTLVLNKPLYTESSVIWKYNEWIEKPTVVSIDSKGSCKILDLSTGTKTISTDIIGCLQTSVLVLANKSEPYIGVLTFALGICTPIVMDRDNLLLKYLGPQNPLILPRINYSALKLTLTSALVKSGFDYMRTNKNMYTIESFLRRIQSSTLGAKTRSILNCVRLFDDDE